MSQVPVQHVLEKSVTGTPVPAEVSVFSQDVMYMADESLLQLAYAHLPDWGAGPSTPAGAGPFGRAVAILDDVPANVLPGPACGHRNGWRILSLPKMYGSTKGLYVVDVSWALLSCSLCGSTIDVSDLNVHGKACGCIFCGTCVLTLWKEQAAAAFQEVTPPGSGASPPYQECTCGDAECKSPLEKAVNVNFLVASKGKSGAVWMAHGSRNSKLQRLVDMWLRVVQSTQARVALVWFSTISMAIQFGLESLNGVVGPRDLSGVWGTFCIDEAPFCYGRSILKIGENWTDVFF